MTQHCVMTDASLYADACVPSCDERWEMGTVSLTYCLGCYHKAQL